MGKKNVKKNTGKPGLSKPEKENQPSRPWIGLAPTVFCTGAGIMIVEMAASRLIAPYYGTSILVWTVLIGALLVFLSTGYWLGGKLADRRPEPAPLYRLILIAGVATCLLPLLASPLLEISVSAVNVSTGEFSAVKLVLPMVGTVLLLAVPIVALGCVSPFAVRLAAGELEHLGNTAGRLYAVSNLGSIAGTFLPVLALIPWLGTRNTFFFAGGLLVLVGVLGLARRRGALWLLLPLLAASLSPNVIRPVEGLVEETESLYHYVQVSKYFGCEKAGGEGVKLYLNEGHSMHSSWCPGHLWLNQIWDWLSIAPYLAGNEEKLEDLLIVGLAAGTVAQQYKELYPDIHIDGVEIDAEVIDMGRKYFDLDRFVSPENQYAMDGRTFLYRTPKRYDVIVLDAFRQPYIPFHLVTVEFFEHVRNHLKTGGIVVMNVNKVQPKRHDLSRLVLATMEQVFGHTISWSSDSFNDILAAADVPLDAEKARERMRASIHPQVRRLERRMNPPKDSKLAGTKGFNLFEAGGEPFTDDRAPVELAWDAMFLGLAETGK